MGASQPATAGERLTAWGWLVDEWQWPQAGLLAAAFLTAVVPLLLNSAGLGLALVFAQLPAYLVHQWEEHAGDRFRAYFNDRFGGGRLLLTRPATFFINLMGVWVLDLAAVYLAFFATPAAGLIAVYLSLINGLSHVGQAVRMREYNPGLLSALILLIPLGAGGAYAVGAGASAAYHAAGLAVAIGLHGAIVVYCRRRMAVLAAND